MARMVTVAAALGLTVAMMSAAAAAPRPAVESANGMVVSSQALASEVGAEILRRGGNAVDAAVAVGYAEAVTNPCCGNIGGGGFMTLHLADGRDVFLDFRETAPARATRDMYLAADGSPVKGLSLHGYLAVGVPGTVLGLDAALSRYGTLPRATVMAPAIRLAREGFVLTRGDTDVIDAGADRLRRDETAARLFFRPDGSNLQPGDRLVQRDLADTLAAIAETGPDAFYGGANAERVATAVEAAGGILTAADLAAYTVTESAPLRCDYRGYVVLSAPPPSSGGTTLCEALNILEGHDLKALGFHSAQSIHLVVEALRHAYMDRNTFLGDPAFVRNPLDRLLSKDYAKAIRDGIDPVRATPSRDVAPGVAPHEKPETTHYSVVDKAGNAVSVTYTINGLFGAGVIAPGTGFFLNDEMDDFTIKAGVPNLYGLVQGEANAIAPRKRPLSSMSPTIVTRDGKVAMVVGSPGGARIITIVLQVMINMIDYGMQPAEAVAAPRIHHQWLPDVVFTEPFGLSPDTIAILRDRGYQITEQTPWGAAELIAVGPPRADAGGPGSSGHDSMFGGEMRPGMTYGANDDRRPAGAAIGE